ncbi:MAG: anti-CBASS Acb1 family protein [Planctomycetota bacterium]|nr:anti-CBASS Acb1 family protein [Planctomycetota bacterium]
MRKSYHDNWASTLGTLGSVRDKSVGQTFRRRERLTRDMVELLVEQNAICRRVVYKLVHDAFRTPWKFKRGELAPFKARLERELELTKRVKKAAGWSRLYGACALAIPAADGRRPDQPLDRTAVRSIAAPSVVPAYQFDPLKYDSAFGSQTYREILLYQVETLNGRQPVLDVHASRMHVFEPHELPIESRIESLESGQTAFGPSVLQLIYDELLREGASRAHANAMMYSASILSIKLRGLADKITTKHGQQEIREELQVLREALDSLGFLALDEGDEIASTSHSFTGARDAVGVQRDALGSALPMPREIGMNESETGLRGGELSGAQALWYGDVGVYRENDLAPAIENIARMAATAWGVPAGEGAFEIEWEPLWVPSEKERSENAHRNAQTDTAYHAMGALGAQEARQARFVDGERGEIRIDKEQAGLVRKAKPYIGPALDVVAKVAAGDIPRDAGMQMLASMGFDPILMGSAGAPEPLAKTMAALENAQ